MSDDFYSFKISPEASIHSRDDAALLQIAAPRITPDLLERASPATLKRVINDNQNPLKAQRVLQILFEQALSIARESGVGISPAYMPNKMFSWQKDGLNTAPATILSAIKAWTGAGNLKDVDYSGFHAANLSIKAVVESLHEQGKLESMHELPFNPLRVLRDLYSDRGFLAVRTSNYLVPILPIKNPTVDKFAVIVDTVTGERRTLSLEGYLGLWIDPNTNLCFSGKVAKPISRSGMGRDSELHNPNPVPFSDNPAASTDHSARMEDQSFFSGLLSILFSPLNLIKDSSLLSSGFGVFHLFTSVTMGHKGQDDNQSETDSKANSEPVIERLSDMDSIKIALNDGDKEKLEYLFRKAVDTGDAGVLIPVIKHALEYYPDSVTDLILRNPNSKHINGILAEIIASGRMNILEKVSGKLSEGKMLEVLTTIRNENGEDPITEALQNHHDNVLNHLATISLKKDYTNLYSLLLQEAIKYDPETLNRLFEKLPEELVAELKKQWRSNF